jgi:hypothetical protein
MVLQVGKKLHEIIGEINRWRQILEVPYQEFLQVGKTWELHEYTH